METFTNLKLDDKTIAFGTGTVWKRGSQGNEDDAELDQQLIDSIITAFRLGYRHVDCAEGYGTEREVGVGLQQFLKENPLLTRDHFFITSKVYTTLNDIPSAIKASLSRLGISYLDLYLIHAPSFSKVNCKATKSEVWSKMETLVDQGLTKFIGVSNYRVRDFKEFLPHARIKPLCNQIPYNPYISQNQSKLIQYCHQQNISVYSFSSLMPLRKRNDGPLYSIVDKMAEKYQRSMAQILLQWVLQKGIIIIVTTSRQEARLRDYLELTKNEREFRLSTEEIKEIDEAGISGS